MDLFIRGHGKISAIARSAKTSKRRFPGGLEPFSKMKVRLKVQANRPLATLEESDIRMGNINIRSSFDKITVASYATELISILVQANEAADEIFHVFELFLSHVAVQEENTLPKLLLGFETALTRFSGFSPSLDACFKCGKDARTFTKYRISRRGEGLICQSCTAGEHYGIADKNTMSVFWTAYHDALIEYADLAQARRIIWASLGPVVDRDMKTRAQVEELWK